MKKLLVILSLMVFVGAYAVQAQSATPQKKTETVAVEKGKKATKAAKVSTTAAKASCCEAGAAEKTGCAATCTEAAACKGEGMKADEKTKKK